MSEETSFTLIVKTEGDEQAGRERVSDPGPPPAPRVEPASLQTPSLTPWVGVVPGTFPGTVTPPGQPPGAPLPPTPPAPSSLHPDESFQRAEVPPPRIPSQEPLQLTPEEIKELKSKYGLTPEQLPPGMLVSTPLPPPPTQQVVPPPSVPPPPPPVNAAPFQLTPEEIKELKAKYGMTPEQLGFPTTPPASAPPSPSQPATAPSPTAPPSPSQPATAPSPTAPPPPQPPAPPQTPPAPVPNPDDQFLDPLSTPGERQRRLAQERDRADMERRFTLEQQLRGGRQSVEEQARAELAREREQRVQQETDQRRREQVEREKQQQRARLENQVLGPADITTAEPEPLTPDQQFLKDFRNRRKQINQRQALLFEEGEIGKEKLDWAQTEEGKSTDPDVTKKQDKTNALLTQQLFGQTMGKGAGAVASLASGAAMVAGPFAVVGAALAIADEIKQKMVGAIRGIGEGMGAAARLDPSGMTKPIHAQLENIPGDLLGFGAALSEAIRAVESFAEGLSQTAERLAPYSGALSVAQAQAEVRQVMGDIRRAQALGPELADFTDIKSRLSQSGQDVMAALIKPLIPQLTKMMLSIEKMMPFIEKMASATGTAMGAVAQDLNALLSFQPQNLVIFKGIEKNTAPVEKEDPTLLTDQLFAQLSGKLVAQPNVPIAPPATP